MLIIVLYWGTLCGVKVVLGEPLRFSMLGDDRVIMVSELIVLEYR